MRYLIRKLELAAIVELIGLGSPGGEAVFAEDRANCSIKGKPQSGSE